MAAAHLHSESEQRVDDALSDNTQARETLNDFRKDRPKPKAKVDISGLIAAFQLSTEQTDHLERTLDALPFSHGLWVGLNVWLDTRLSFHQSTPCHFQKETI